VKTDLFSIPLFTFEVTSQKKELHDLALKLEKEKNGNNISNNF